MSPEQYHAPSILDVEPPYDLNPLSDSDMVPAPEPNHDTDPRLGDPPTLKELVLVNCKSLAPATSSSSPRLSGEDNPLVDLTAMNSVEDQELASPNAELLDFSGKSDFDKLVPSVYTSFPSTESLIFLCSNFILKEVPE